MLEPLSDTELSTIRARLDDCLPGPWIHRGGGFIETPDRQVIGVTCAGNGDCGGAEKLPRAAHAQFLAAAREDVPRLLYEVDRLRAEVERLQLKANFSREEIPLAPVSIHSDAW